MFARVSLPDVPDVARRTVMGAVVVGLAALVAAVSFGYALVGLGVALGLALGTVNFRMVGTSVSRAAGRADRRVRRPLALNTVGRMAVITVVTLGLLILSPQLGFGALGGLALFQLLLVFNVARSMVKAGGPPLDAVDVDAEPVVDPRPEVD